MERLSALNVVGVAAIALLAAVSAALALLGLATGSAHSIPAFPQWDLLGPTRSQQLEALTAVLPVLIACYNAAQSLHPLMPLVRPYSEKRMRKVIALALAVSFGIYWTLSVGAVMAFGTDVEVGPLKSGSLFCCCVYMEL
jgi:amino acid permease